MKRILSLFLVIAMVVGMVGCNKQQETNTKDVGQAQNKSTKPVEIEFWHALADENGEVLQSLVDKFNKQNPNIKVKAVFQGHYKELFEKLNGAAQAGNLPTLSMIYCNRLSAYVLNDLVQELDPYIFDKKIGMDKKIWEDIPKPLRDNGMWNGKHFSLPFNKSAYLMYYNVDALKEAGVEVPTTWEELKEAGKKLSKDGKKGIAFNKSVGVDFSYWVEQAGGHIYDEKTDTILIDTPETKKAYEFIVGMVKEGIGKVAFEDGYITGPMSRGESFIGFATSSNLPEMEEACKETGVNWAVAELPKGEKQASLFAGTDITMFNTSTDEQKKAAWEFMKFWFAEETTTEWGIKSGYLPMTNSSTRSDKFQEFLKTDSSKKVALDQFSYAYQDPKVLNGYAIHKNMQEALEEILSGKKTIEQALKDAQQNTRKELDEAKKSFAKE
ncbi:putative carbohydrate uptake ABC transporter periplasmic-binding protein [Gottschalkia purinilytica]|uniref:Putative carbohydrate uptake ABC transporter periplasmic-binding protein n=1 Tax=Gottschalkia purinilytica TaxID=1503 RepID=A0A0L0W8V2_GOTPU|nr:ABC transporter substrate-binding protein [Gottschalkia purinilytica]KNF07735.1 putative carbohydrate uptake ABC transporter periplasmic-binding protein [Gottschalkia purinilytica]